MGTGVTSVPTERPLEPLVSLPGVTPARGDPDGARRDPGNSPKGHCAPATVLDAPVSQRPQGLLGWDSVLGGPYWDPAQGKKSFISPGANLSLSPAPG